jgi:putative hemolysin
MGGRAALDHVSGLLALKVEVQGLENLPADRPLSSANHPTGIADGVAVYDALKARRPDLTFYANADALRVCPAWTRC